MVSSSHFSSILPLDPFGYDKNDLNMDHFTHVIIRKSPLPSRTPQCLNFFIQGKNFVQLPPLPLPTLLSGHFLTSMTAFLLPIPASRETTTIVLLPESGCVVDLAPCRVRFSWRRRFPLEMNTQTFPEKSYCFPTITSCWVSWRLFPNFFCVITAQ